MSANYFSVAVTGDSIINRRLSVYKEERFLSMVEVLRDADVSFTHLETLIHDYDGDDVYPAAEAWWGAVRCRRRRRAAGSVRTRRAGVR